MDQSSSGDQRNRSSQNRQGQRGGRRRQDNRGGNRESSQSGRRSRGSGGPRNRQDGGKREYRPSKRGRQQMQKKPSFGQKLLSILTLGLLGGPDKASSKPKSREGGKSSQKTRPVERAEVTSPRLYVGNLNYRTTDADLEQFFSKVGTVKSAEVVINRRSQKSKGFAFVEMGSLEEARKAVKSCHNEEFMGRRMLVSGAKSPGTSSDDDERPKRRESGSRASDSSRKDSSGGDNGRRRDRFDEEEERPKAIKKEEPVVVTGSRLRLNNLDYEVGESELEELFKGVGVVVSTEVAADPETHQSKGYGFVEMSHIDEAKRAVEILNNKDFMGRRLSIADAPNEKDDEQAESTSTVGA